MKRWSVNATSSTLLKRLKSSYLEYHQSPRGSGTSHSCYRWRGVDLWRSIRGREEGEEAGGSHQPPDRTETIRLNPSGADITAEYDAWWSYWWGWTGPGSRQLQWQRGHRGGFRDHWRLLLSLLLSSVLTQLWGHLRQLTLSAKVTFLSSGQQHQGVVLPLTVAPLDPVYLQPPTGPLGGPTCAAIAATGAPACPRSADCTSCTCWVWRGGVLDPSGVWQKERIVKLILAVQSPFIKAHSHLGTCSR